MTQFNQSEINALFMDLYQELYKRARRAFHHGGPARSYQPSDLVNDAFIRLQNAGEMSWETRDHFLNSASIAMRTILVDRFRAKSSLKRDHKREDIEMSLIADSFEQSAIDLDLLDKALDQLAIRNPTMAQMVTLRFFGGVSMADISRITEVPLRTLERDWKITRALLRTEIDPITA